MITIEWQQRCSWEVTIAWAKNTSLPLIAASLLLDHVKLTNIPDVLDIHDFIHFLESIWSKCHFKDNELEIDNSQLSTENIDFSQVGRTRAWIYFVSWLLYRFWKVNFPYPKWDKIWKRPLDEHFDWFKWMGYGLTLSDDDFTVIWPWSEKDVTINTYFRVTATMNMVIAAVARKWVTHIKMTAFEPHIFCLIDFFRKAWADIRVRYDHEVIIHGWKELNSHVEHECISDYLQSGTFAILWALASEKYIDIHRARMDDLEAFRYCLHKTWVRTEDMWWDTMRVFKWENLTATKIQTNIFPWFPTDLMPLFAVLMTQCEWMNRIFEILYEWRLNWLVELEQMWAEIAITNPHEAYIYWKSNLHGANTNSWDLRAWAALIIAWAIAEGTTTIDNVYWIERGYENLYERLRDLWIQLSIKK